MPDASSLLMAVPFAVGLAICLVGGFCLFICLVALSFDLIAHLAARFKTGGK